MDKLLVTESYKKVLKQLNKAIQVYRDEQDVLAIDSLGYRESIRNQLVLEKAKLEIIKNLGIEYGSSISHWTDALANTIPIDSIKTPYTANFSEDNGRPITK